MLSQLKSRFGFHPRALLHAIATYPRFLGRIKPALLDVTEDEVRSRLAALPLCWEPVQLHVPIARRILVVAPHPDDETIGAGGLLLLHRGKSQVDLLNLFNGEGGGKLLHSDFTDSEAAQRAKLAEKRRQELENVARELGIEQIHSMSLPDGGSISHPGAVRELQRILEKSRPEVVLIPWYLDGQGDHRAANILFAAASEHFDGLVLGYEIWSLCPANAFADITDVLEKKARLVEHYQTQLADIDYTAYLRGLAQVRGFQFSIGTRRGGAAEAFFSLPNRDYRKLVQSLYGTPENMTQYSISRR